LIGAALGILLGIIITVVLYMWHDRTPVTLAPTDVIAPTRERSTSPPGEGVRTLGPGEVATTGAVAPSLSPKGEALLLIIGTHLRTGNFEKAQNAALAMDAGPERDAGLKAIADRLVPAASQENLGLLDSASDRSRATAIEKLRKLVKLAELADGLTESRLLLRAAMVKRKLDEARPDPTESPANDLDPEHLIARAEAVAKAMPSSPAVRPFQWAWGAVLSGGLGLLGYLSTHLAEPLVNAFAAAFAAVALRRTGIDALAEKAKLEEDKGLKA
jgi:hypothetical protein